MREEHPKQQELPNLPPGGPVPAPIFVSEEVREMSEVAALQSQVLPLGLVREARPVFVYDAKLARQKSGNAERQERHRKKIADSGLVVMTIPRAIASAVKLAGGDWAKIEDALGKEPKTSEVSAGGDGVITQSQKNEFTQAGGFDHWLQKKIDFSIASLPPVPPVAPRIVEKIVEKLIEKPVLRLTAEQKKTLELGQKVARLTGWRASVLAFLLR